MKYEVEGFYDRNYIGLSESYDADEQSVDDIVWDMLNNGDFVRVCDVDTGETWEFDPENIDRYYYDGELDLGIVESKSKKPSKSKTYPRKRVKVGRKTMYLPDDGKGHVPKAYLKDVNSKRSTRSLAQDNIHRASMTYPSPTPRYMAANWIRHPNKYDIEGIDAPQRPSKAKTAVKKTVEKPKQYPKGINAKMRAKHDWEDMKAQEIYETSYNKTKKSGKGPTSVSKGIKAVIKEERSTPNPYVGDTVGTVLYFDDGFRGRNGERITDFCDGDPFPDSFDLYEFRTMADPFAHLEKFGCVAVPVYDELLGGVIGYSVIGTRQLDRLGISRAKAKATMKREAQQYMDYSRGKGWHYYVIEGDWPDMVDGTPETVKRLPSGRILADDTLSNYDDAVASGKFVTREIIGRLKR